MTSIQSFLITRFNVLTGYAKDNRRLTSEWLEERISLLEKYCAPSVMSQTDLGFRWLLFCDVDTPPEIIKKLQGVSDKIEPVFISGELNQNSLNEALTTLLDGQEVEYVSTTRLDSDDSLSIRFMEIVKSNLRAEHGTWYQFERGYQDVGGLLLKSKWVSNPFLTLVEKVDAGIKTGFSYNHANVEKICAINSMSGASWMQTIHGGNTSVDSQARGIYVRTGNTEHLRQEFVREWQDAAVLSWQIKFKTVAIAFGREMGRRLKRGLGFQSRSV